MEGIFTPRMVGILGFQSQAVVDLAVLPGDNVDDEIDTGAVLDGAHAEELGHVDDANAAKLNIVPQHVRRAADELVVRRCA